MTYERDGRRPCHKALFAGIWRSRYRCAHTFASKTILGLEKRLFRAVHRPAQARRTFSPAQAPWERNFPDLILDGTRTSTPPASSKDDLQGGQDRQMWSTT